MSTPYEIALHAELRRIGDAEYELQVRGAHVRSAIALLREEASEESVRAMLCAKQILILCNPPAHAERRA